MGDDLREKSRQVLEDVQTLYGGAGTFTDEQLTGYAVGVIQAAMMQAIRAERERLIGLLAAAHANKHSLEMGLGPSEFFGLLERIRSGAKA